jgi:cation:H+ antiporter
VQFFGSLLLDTEADQMLNLVLSGVYVALAVVNFVRQRHLLARTVRDGVVTPFEELQEADEEAETRDRPRDRPAGDRESA